MKKFILRRIMKHTERIEVDAESWADAVLMLDEYLKGSDIDSRSVILDGNIEFVCYID